MVIEIAALLNGDRGSSGPLIPALKYLRRAFSRIICEGIGEIEPIFIPDG
jgi:hypothetical protein